METVAPLPDPPGPDEARTALAAVERAARGAAVQVELPASYSLLTGTGNAVFVYGIAVGNSDWRFGSAAFVVSLAAFALLAVLARGRFRERNGVWINGLRGPGGALLVVAGFLAIFVPCIAGSTVLMIVGHPVWSAVVALAALPLTALADRAWLAAFRRAHVAPA